MNDQEYELCLWRSARAIALKTRLNNQNNPFWTAKTHKLSRLNCFRSSNFPHVFFQNAGLWLDRLKCTKKRAHLNTKGLALTKGRLFQNTATNFRFVSRHQVFLTNQYLVSVWCWTGFPGRKVLWRKPGHSCYKFRKITPVFNERSLR